MTVRVGILPHRERDAALALAHEAATWLAAHGATAVFPKVEAELVGLPALGVDPEVFPDGLDVVVSLGGDGTMLRTIDQAYDSGVAVLGVNVGQMGYLTEVEPADLSVALERLLRGDYHVEERMMLAVDVRSSGPADGRWFALNETVIEKVRTGHMARLDVGINGAFFTTYAADALIVATPTGSTAYSFSARGPIVSPRHRCLLLTPVSPHMLFDRALVLDAAEQVGITITGSIGAAMTVDGREIGFLDPGDEIACSAAPKPARVVSFVPRDFHQILKAKFGLADR
ncbi:MAG: NAD(+)/NADH kinase [Actinomycetota bacterium]